MSQFQKALVITGLCFMVIFTATTVYGSLLDERYNSPDFNTPAGIGSHVFNFFHHSCGGNLLSDGLAADMTGLGYTLHSEIDNQYIYENNDTDYRHWYKRFQRELGIENGGVYYVFTGPDAFGNPTYGSAIPEDQFMLTWYEFHAESMDIIMFKPCYPGAAVGNYDTTYDGTTSNNGYGQVIGGTPHSDSSGTYSNFDYLNSSSSVASAYDNTYWPGNGSWGSSSSTLAQLKTAYRGMLNIFREHPDILFIALQAPPMIPNSMTDDQAANCREFARWMREDWLHQLDPTGTDQFEDYLLPNVVPFDFENSVAWTGDDPDLDADYFWFVQGGFPDESMDTATAGLIGKSASSNTGDSHPQTWQNQRLSTIFCGGVDTYSPSHTGNSGRTYDCWINAVVNLWESGMGPTPTPGPIVPSTSSSGVSVLILIISGILLISLRSRR